MGGTSGMFRRCVLKNAVTGIDESGEMVQKRRIAACPIHHETCKSNQDISINDHN